MNGAIEHAIRKKEQRPQTDLPSVISAKGIRGRAPESEGIRDCPGRYCGEGNPIASIAFAFKAIGKEGRKMFEEKRAMGLEQMIRPFTNGDADFRQASMYAAEIGLDRIVEYARSPTSENARPAIEAMEKCAIAYPEAATAAKYFIKEHFVLAAMMVARQHFKERGTGNYADRATAAIDKVRSKEMDPYYAEDIKAIIKGTPKEIF